MVTKSTLAPFDCSTKNGVSTMDAEPSIVCDGSGAHGRMKTVGIIMVVVFVLGVPMSFGALVVYYRRAMQADQFLRVWGEGDSSVTNPNIHIRRRYRKLYEVRRSIAAIAIELSCELSLPTLVNPIVDADVKFALLRFVPPIQDYKPQFKHWKLVLLTRKLVFALVVVLFNHTVETQVGENDLRPAGNAMVDTD